MVITNMPNKHAKSMIYMVEFDNIKKLVDLNKVSDYDYRKLNFNIDDTASLINDILLLCSPGPVNDIIKNYKMSYYRPLYELAVNIILNRPLKEQTLIFNIIHNNLLTKLSTIDKSHLLLNRIRHLIRDDLFEDNLVKETFLEVVVSKGAFPSFIFWKNRLNIDIFSDSTQKLFKLSISNADDRIYKWFLDEFKKADKNIIFQKYEVITSLLNNILQSNIPVKYILKRVRLLSTYCNLAQYFHHMVQCTFSGEILFELFKYYYITPLSFDDLETFLNRIEGLGKGVHIFPKLLTDNEKFHFVVHKITENNTLCLGEIGSFVDVIKTIKIESLTDTSYAPLLNYIKSMAVFHKYDSFEEDESLNVYFGSLTDCFSYECVCGKKCFGSMLKFVIEKGLFQNIQNCNKIPNVLLLLSKFYSQPPKGGCLCNNCDNKSKDYIKINLLLHFLRLTAKKYKKTKVIEFKTSYLPIINELCNFKPCNKPVLSRGSRNWQYQNQKFSLVPPRHLLPYEFTNYKSFLIREKADGILLNTLPTNIYPKVEEFALYNVKAEYLEELDLYLIFDINLPNTSYEERYKFLRDLHPLVKDKELVMINSIDTLKDAITEERKIVAEFLKTDNIKWYPKACYKFENHTDTTFYNDLITNILICNDSEFNKFINESGPFQCDGLIITPLLNGNREIKIKPKNLMTIDLLYDGKKWFDKEKNIYNNIEAEINLKPNKIYRCYPIGPNKYQARDIRFDKKYPNSQEIIGTINNIYNFDWSENTIIKPYYEETKSINNMNLIKELREQNDIFVSRLKSLNPENGKTWLDLGCGKGKLIDLIKEYNPKSYIGMDIDINKLLQRFYLQEQYEWVRFNPVDITKNWYEKQIWYNIKAQTYDYIVMNFSIMYAFNSDVFWEQLVKCCHSKTKILFNITSEKLNTVEYNKNGAYMKYNPTENKVVCYFPWVSSKERMEDFISRKDVENKMLKYGFLIDTIYQNESDNLTGFYDWFLITKV